MIYNILFQYIPNNLSNEIKFYFDSYQNDWEIFYANNLDTALEITATNNIDVVFAEFDPKVESTFEIFKLLKEKYPKIIRIGFSGYSNNELASRKIEFIHRLIWRPFSADKIKEQIEKIFFLQNLLQNENIIKVTNSLDHLPSLPDIFLALEREMNSPYSSFKKMAMIIVKDVTLTAKILKVVNSAYFGLNNKVIDIVQALNLLGIEIVKSIVLFEKTFSTKEFSNIPSSVISSLWEHSFRTANICKQITKIETNDSKLCEIAYISGLLHDIGKLIVWKVLPKHNPAILKQKKLMEIDYLDEYDIFDTSHAEIGAYLLGLWGFPENVVESISLHHLLNRTPITGFSVYLSLFLANFLANSNVLPIEMDLNDFPLSDQTKKYILEL